MENMVNFVVITMPMGSLAPLDARTSATLMINRSRSCIYTGPAFDTFTCIFNENYYIFIKISLELVCKGPVNDMSVLLGTNLMS